MAQTKTQAALNQLTADLSQASAAIHQIHWYLRGFGFKSYHELMDEYRGQVEDQLDAVAERLIIIDGSPVSTLEEFAANTRIDSIEPRWDKEITEWLERLIAIFRGLIKSYDEGIDAAQADGDDVTEDMMIEFKGQIQLNIWMMQAELGQAPNN